MNLPVIRETIILRTKRDVLRLHLYTKLVQKDIKATSSEIDVAMELYDFGGFNDKENEEIFFSRCIEKGYRDTDQSVRNVLAKFTKAGVMKRPRRHSRFLLEDFIPAVDTEMIGLEYKIINAPS